jgi:hypothetical protein
MLFYNIACCNAAKRQWKSFEEAFSKSGWLGNENCSITLQPTN